MPALPCEALVPQPCGHHSSGDPLLRRASRRRRHVVPTIVLRGSVLPLRSVGLQGQFPLGCFALQRLATPAAVAAYADPVPRGQRAPLDEFRTLLIDGSAGGGTWRRTRERQSSVHSSDSSRDASQGSLRRHTLSTHLDLHVEAVMPSWHLHRRLALLTHLEHPVEDHCDRCRSSFCVDSSRLV